LSSVLFHHDNWRHAERQPAIGLVVPLGIDHRRSVRLGFDWITLSA